MSVYKQFKLVNGDEVLAQVIDNDFENPELDNKVVVKNAMMIIRAEIDRNGISYYSFRSWMAFQLGNDVFQLLSINQVVGEASPDKILLEQYLKVINVDTETTLNENSLQSSSNNHSDSDNNNIIPIFNKSKLH